MRLPLFVCADIKCALKVPPNAPVFIMCILLSRITAYLSVYSFTRSYVFSVFEREENPSTITSTLKEMDSPGLEWAAIAGEDCLMFQMH